MPSIVTHTVAGFNLLKKLNLNEEDTIKFYIGNVLPDSRSMDKPDDMDEFEFRKLIQEEKVRTHFRTNIGGVIEYPDIDYFYNKYKNIVNKDIMTFGYFFHLYVDYYYFNFYLPKMVEFYDNNYNEITKRVENRYTKIVRTNKYVDTKLFWSKYDNNSLYYEYYRMDKYLIEKYNLKLDFDSINYYINNNDITNYIEEANSNYIDIIRRLKDDIKLSYDYNIDDLVVFDTESFDQFIQESINTFVNKYMKEDEIYV